MKKRLFQKLIAASLTLTMVLTQPFVLSNVNAENKPEKSVPGENYMKLWYDETADHWQSQALPIGNGNIGGMIFGKTDRERVQLNEITLWAGGPNSSPDYNGGNAEGAYQNIPEIREALFAGDYAKATELSKKLLGNQVGYNGYQDLGSLYMNFIGDAKTTSPENYRRELDLNDSIQRVSYQNKGVNFKREYFCSNPDKLMVIHLTADQKDKLEFELSLELNTSNAGNTPGNYPTPSKNYKTWVEDNTIFCQGKESSSLMAFAVQIKVIAPNATLSTSGTSINITDGEDVTILMSAKTNYDIEEAQNIKSIEDFHTENGDYLANDDPDGDLAMQQVAEWIETGTDLGYQELLERHMEDYKDLYERADIVLGDGDFEYADLTTDKLLNAYKSGEKNRYLETLLFQFGRYLLISSSRDSQLPANLQGLWNDSNQPPWMGDYHFDVNLEMNYWPAFVTNLSETADPLVTYVDSLRGSGSVTAKEVFGVPEGWLVNAQTNIFGLTGTNSWELAWGFQPGCAAWICNNLWDYYLFTQDPKVLEKVYPIMKEAALFWKHWLVEDPGTQQRDESGNPVPGTGELVAAPSLSPEQTGVTVSVGASYDMMLSYMLFQDVIEAGEILNTDEEFRAELAEMMTRMKPIQIGESGQIKEFREETTADSMPGAERGHRHMSQMMALHPGSMITQETPEWMDAAITSLNYRGEGNGNGTGGWSMAQKGNLWARTGDGERALHFLQKLITGGGIYGNLFDQIGCFQIDGNLGYTAGVAEILLQSHAGYIEPLAALPSDWKDGSYQGLVARGNFETDAEWKEGKLEKFTVRSGSGKECIIRYPNVSSAVLTRNGETVDYEMIDRNTISFATEIGAEYVLNKIPSSLNAPENITVKRQDINTLNVKWDKVEGAESYNIYRYLKDAGNALRVGFHVSETEFRDETALRLTEDEKYSYMVVAVDGNGVEGRNAQWVQEKPNEEIIQNDAPQVKYTYEGNTNYWRNDGTVQWLAFYEIGLNGPFPVHTAMLEFEGTGIEVYCKRSTNEDAVDIYIDGELIEDDYEVFSKTEQRAVLLYRVNGLDEGKHTIELKTDDTINHKEEMGTWPLPTFNIDYFKVLHDNGTLVDSIEVTSSNGVTLLESPGQKIQLMAEVLPYSAVHSEVVWKVTDESGKDTSLVTIDQNGVLRATDKVGVGNVIVTATAKDGSNATGSFEVSVATDRSAHDSATNLLLNVPVKLTEGAHMGGSLTETNLTDGFCGDTINSDKDSGFFKRLATRSANPVTLEFELGAFYQIDSVHLYEFMEPGTTETRTDETILEVWDGTNWVEVGKSDNKLIKEEDRLSPYCGKRVVACTGDTIATNKLRVKLKDNSNSLSIWEMEAYGTKADVLPPIVDKSSLYSILDKAALYIENDFPEGWEQFTIAHEEAIAVANNPRATQTAVSDAVNLLIKAIGNVTAIPKLQEIFVKSISSKIPVGRAVPLEVIAVYDRGIPVDMTEGSTFSVEGDTVVLDKNKVTGMKSGEAKVTASLEDKRAEIALDVVGLEGKLNIVAGEGGKVQSDPERDYFVQQNVTLTAMADSGYQFSYWKVDGKNMSENPITVTVGKEYSIQAYFEKEEKVVNKELLQRSYDYAKTLSTDGVTDSAKTFFENALANAKAVLDDADATQGEVNAAWDHLLEGIWGLGIVKGDTTMLEMLINRADAMMAEQDRYVQGNLQQLVDALAAAKEVVNDGDALEEDVQPAADALLDAILAQRYKANKDNLKDLIDKAEGLDLSKYTKESVMDFRTALKTAKAVMTDESLSEAEQEVVNQAVEELNLAIKGLKLVSNDGKDDDNKDNQNNVGDKDNSESSSGKAPKTADGANSAVWFIMLVLGAIYLAFQKNNLVNRIEKK